MRKIILAILTAAVLPLFANGQATGNGAGINLDFERHEGGLPSEWIVMNAPAYSVYLDSATVKSGKYSLVIEHKEGEEAGFEGVILILPENYTGKSITLSGYIKTENITGGYAGLFMRIDPMLAYDDMSDKGVSGTTDWTKYQITLLMSPSKTTRMAIGVLMAGKGKAWFDDLSVTIDGKDISEAVIYVKEIKPAEKDKEFDGGSGIVLPELNPRLVGNLDLLGKVWGFLKYHHPEVGRGNYNWDYELFRILPRYTDAVTAEERDKVLLGWIDGYGMPESADSPEETREDAFLRPDFSWMDKSNMASALKERIMEIYENRHKGEHFYIDMFASGNPDFIHENPYPEMSCPDAGFRLLSLYRYWNMIRYFFPYRHLTDKNWDDVLREYIPLFINASTRLEYELAALRIIGEVSDTHANLWGGADKVNELRGYMHAPFRAQFIEGRLVVTDYFNPELKDTAELEIGDVITHLNGRSVESLTDSMRIYCPASNEPTKLRDIADELLRSADSVMNVTYLSTEGQKHKELALYKRDELNIYRYYKRTKEKCYKFIGDDIGYVTLADIKRDDIPRIKEDFRNTKGIIIDIRNYPSTFVPFLLGSYFVSDTTPFVKFTKGNVNNPGEFSFTRNINIPKPDETYTGKLVVIVNECSQSQSEYTAMAFRAGDNTTIVGSTTAGADGDVSVIWLPGGLRTMISGIGVYYPDGTETQRAGIVPDVWVEPTLNDIRNGRDTVLEKAIEIINRAN